MTGKTGKTGKNRQKPAKTGKKTTPGDSFFSNRAKGTARAESGQRRRPTPNVRSKFSMKWGIPMFETSEARKATDPTS